MNKNKIKKNKKHPMKKTISQKKDEKDFIGYLKTKPFFVGFVIIILLVILFILLTPKYNLNENLLSATYGNNLHTQHQEALDYYLLEVKSKLNGDYSTTLDDDYYQSYKEDILWLKQKLTNLKNDSISNYYLKELAFNMALESILIINEEIPYDFYIINKEERIFSSLNEKYFDQNFEYNVDVMDLFSGENEKYKIFVEEYNKIMNEYFNQKIFIINNSKEVERKFIEANKIFILSDPLALS